MNQKNLMLTPIFALARNLFTVFSLCLFFAEKAVCIDSQYLACNTETCGDGQNITFPFYIQDVQPPSCGYPGFNLVCNKKIGKPILKLSGNDYIVQKIFYKNHSLLVSDATVFDDANSSTSDDRSCIPLIQNFSLPEGGKFNFSSYHSDLILLYNCDPSNLGVNRSVELVKHGFKYCNTSEGARSLSIAVFEDDPLFLKYDAPTSKCENVVVAPVEVKGTGLKRMLEKGFLLNWVATNCSVCKESGGRCGFDYTMYHFACYCPDRPHSWRCVPGNQNSQLKLAVLGSCVGVLAVISIFLSIFYCYKQRQLSAKSLSSNSDSHPFRKPNQEEGNACFGIPIFSYTDLEVATNNFDGDKEVGDGGFGTVYYGKLQDGREVAVKRLYEHNYKRVEQFMNEVQILTRLRHKNLVSLYGCTSRHSRELLLVFEYIPNGTVADHLHGDRSKSSPLTWPMRMSIAIESAAALAYLHASDIIHRDVKTHNILLDSNFCVKVADFGLSRLCPNDVTHVSTAPQGSPGYVDPEYHQFYQLTDKSDVYSFGVVLIELISSMPAVDISRSRNEINLSNLAIDRIQRRAFDDLIDPSLGYESDDNVKRMTTSVAELAFRCLQQDKERRPSMDEVLDELKRIYSVERSENPKEVSDEAALVKSVNLPRSPDSVTEKWVSACSTTPNVIN